MRGFSDLHNGLCKFRLVDACIKRSGIDNMARRIKSEILRKYQNREEYVRCLKNKRVD